MLEKLRHITANQLHNKCEIQNVPADGNCLFTSLALQLNRSEPDAGARVRAEIVTYLESHPEVVSTICNRLWSISLALSFKGQSLPLLKILSSIASSGPNSRIFGRDFPHDYDFWITVFLIFHVFLHYTFSFVTMRYLKLASCSLLGACNSAKLPPKVELLTVEGYLSVMLFVCLWSVCVNHMWCGKMCEAIKRSIAGQLNS